MRTKDCGILMAGVVIGRAWSTIRMPIRGEGQTRGHSHAAYRGFMPTHAMPAHFCRQTLPGCSVAPAYDGTLV